MERRHFVRTTLAGAASAAVGLAAAPAARAAQTPALHNIVFTENDPGHFAGLQKLHVPIVKVANGVLKVRTPHPMSEAHYIVSHTVVLEDGRFLSRKTFNWHDKPISEHPLPAGFKGTVTITSTCNLHDWWLTRVTV